MSPRLPRNRAPLAWLSTEAVANVLFACAMGVLGCALLVWGLTTCANTVGAC